MRAALLALLAAAPAAAQQVDPAPFRPVLERCLAGRPPEARMDCVGHAAEACSEAVEGGWTTRGMSACAAMEAALWDERLNAAWGPAMAWAKRMDEAERDAFEGRFSNRAETLLAAQRAWLAFRDAQCAYAHAEWGSGSMRAIAHPTCMMDVVAERSLFLEGVPATE